VFATLGLSERLVTLTPGFPVRVAS
jgi:hypothetical protein